MNGGFGGAPKFPPSMALEFLLRHHERTGSADGAARWSTATAERDGPRRHVRPARRRVRPLQRRRALGRPALREDALRQRAAAAGLRRTSPGSTGAALARRVAEETAEFLLRDLRTPEGGFASALDADTDGVEGLTYAWTPAAAAPRCSATRTAPGRRDLLAVTPAGTFEHGSSTLQLPRGSRRPGALASGCGPRCSPRGRRARSPPVTTRSSRHGTGWRCSRSPRRAPRWAGRTGWPPPTRRADLLLDAARRRRPAAPRRRATAPSAPRPGCWRTTPSSPRRCSRCIRPPGAAHWLEQAVELLDARAGALRRPGDGGFFDTADDAEALLHRPRELTDGATPSGASALTGALLTASVLVDDPQRHRDAADAALRRTAAWPRQFPAVRRPLADGRRGGGCGARCRSPWSASDDRGTRSPRHARAIAPGGTVVVAGAAGRSGVPLLAHRPLVDGAAAAYVCRGFICDRPSRPSRSSPPPSLTRAPSHPAAAGVAAFVSSDARAVSA